MLTTKRSLLRTVSFALVGATSVAQGCSSSQISPSSGSPVDSGSSGSPLDAGSVGPHIDARAPTDAGCAADAALPRGDFALPTPTGPYGIVRGARRTMVDTSRDLDGNQLDGGEAGDAGASRPLSVEVWYPGDPCNPSETVAYCDPVEGLHAAVTPQQTAHIHTHAHANAAFARGLGARPLLLFSHGLTAAPRSYQSFLEEMASHGYVVAAISHTLFAGVTVFADGGFVGLGPENSSSTLTLAKGDADAVVLVADARFVLDRLVEVNAADPAGELTGHLDLTKVGMFGHSYGGSTSLGTALADPRVKAAIDLDGTVFGAARSAATSTPLFLFQSDRADGGYDPSFASVFAAATGPALAGRLAGSAHANFGDFILLDDDVGVKIPGVMGGSIDPARAIQVIDAYVLAFFDQELEGRPSTLLTGPSSLYPEVVDFQKKP